MEVTEALVRHVAKLARIELTDAEVAATVPQLARILHHVEAVSAIAVKDASPSGRAPAGRTAVAMDALRADEPQPSLDRKAALANAPSHDHVFFMVPRVLGDD